MRRTKRQKILAEARHHQLYSINQSEGAVRLDENSSKNVLLEMVERKSEKPILTMTTKERASLRDYSYVTRGIKNTVTIVVVLFLLNIVLLVLLQRNIIPINF